MKKFPFIPLVFLIVSSFYAIDVYANEREAMVNRIVGTFAAQQVADRILLTAGMRPGPSAIVSSLLAFGGSLAIQHAMKQKLSEKVAGHTGAGAAIGLGFSLVFQIGGSQKSEPEEELRRGININITNTNNNGTREEK